MQLRGDLDQLVARRFLAPQVEDTAERARDEARRRAPDGKYWLSARDERVRTSHREADGQTVPANVPYRVPPTPYTPSGRPELADAPRDPRLHISNRANCRCVAVSLPAAVRTSIHAGDVEVFGTRVRAEVATRFPRAAESEHAETGGGWMAAGLDAARRRD